MPRDPEFYESDSPCRKCGGTLRYRAKEKRGQCLGCTEAKEADQRLVNWIRATGRDEEFEEPVEVLEESCPFHPGLSCFPFCLRRP